MNPTRIGMLGALAVCVTIGLTEELHHPIPPQHRWERWAAGTVIVSGESRHRRAAFVYLAGYASLPEHQLPLAEGMWTPHGTRFVVPQAPLPVFIPDGLRRAFWLVDYRRRHALRQEPSGMHTMSMERPPGSLAARAWTIALLDEIEPRLGIPPERTVIGGFSQGAMLAGDVALAWEQRPAALVMISGAMIAGPDWLAACERRRGLPVFVAHGVNDPLIPVGLSERMAFQLRREGLQVEFHTHRLGHETSIDSVRQLSRFLRDVVPPMPAAR